MDIKAIYRNDPERPLKDPVLEPGGRRFVFRLHRGDFAHPDHMDPDGWFGPELPRYVIRIRDITLPFIAWKWPFINRCCYLGGKAYGADDPNYVWLAEIDRAPGSTAMHFSVRPFARMK